MQKHGFYIDCMLIYIYQNDCAKMFTSYTKHWTIFVKKIVCLEPEVYGSVKLSRLTYCNIEELYLEKDIYFFICQENYPSLLACFYIR